MIHPYVYKIINTNTNEFYIGYRSKNVYFKRTPEDDFLKFYFSSGSLSRELKENLDNFKGYILFSSSEYDSAYWYEQLLIRENISNPLCKNRHYIDPDTGNNIFSMSGKSNKWGTHTQEAKDKIRESKIGKKRIPFSDSHLSNLSIAGRGRIFSIEHRNNISKSQLGKIKSFRNKTYEEIYGLERALELKNIRKVKKEIITCPHCKKSGGKPAMIRFHFENCNPKI